MYGYMGRYDDCELPVKDIGIEPPWEEPYDYMDLKRLERTVERKNQEEVDREYRKVLLKGNVLK